MSRDIYPSLSGATAAWRHLEVVANNVSNTDTAGYKEQRVRFQNVMVNKGLLGDGFVQADHSGINLQDGEVIPDNVSTHLALRGRAFFTVQTPQGEVMQRVGNFTLDNQGFLTNTDGERVLGQSGPIQIINGLGAVQGDVTVARDGTVFVDGFELDRLKIVDANNPEPIGGSKWIAPEGFRTLQPIEVNVVQGALEGSNVDPMRAMTDLVQTSRYFEMYQKAMQTSNELDSRNLQVVSKQS